MSLVQKNMTIKEKDSSSDNGYSELYPKTLTEQVYTSASGTQTVDDVFSQDGVIVGSSTGPVTTCPTETASLLDIMTVDMFELEDVELVDAAQASATQITLVAANWSSKTQTVSNITGVTTNNNIIVSPIPAQQDKYSAAGVLCTAQASEALTFTCEDVPENDLTVSILIIS